MEPEVAYIVQSMVRGSKGICLLPAKDRGNAGTVNKVDEIQ